MSTIVRKEAWHFVFCHPKKWERYMEKNSLTIYFNEEEHEKLEEAKKYCVLNGTALCKVLIKNGLNELNKSNELVFHFDKCKKVDKKRFRTKVINLDEGLRFDMEEICNSTPFSMSALAKYLIMPRITEIVERKEWDYRP